MDFKQTALNYTAPKTPNICDLEAFSISAPIEEANGIDSKGKPYHYFVAVIAGIEYKIPNPVMAAVKAYLVAKPDAKTFKATKEGAGKLTKYQVLCLE